MNLSLELRQQLTELAAAHKAKRLVLFGSRARGDHHENSDIDLAVYGMPAEQQAAFSFALEDLPTLLKFDIVHITAQTSPELLHNIEKDGVLLMEKLSVKYTNLKNAYQRLLEAIKEYNVTHSEIVRDGVIQRFEFTCELAWKTVREFLLDQGFVDINSPKAVMKQAFAYGMIRNEQAWIQLLNDRNLTAHIYDSNTAAEIYQRIVDSHVNSFAQLLIELEAAIL